MSERNRKTLAFVFPSERRNEALLMINFSKIEEELLKYWQENKIFEKTLEKESPKGDYVFYDGPPFATGLPHYGHIVASLMKDVIPRYYTMKGYHVERKWGWDCHGLPIENIVEKEIGTKSKKDIEEIGIDKFNEKCRSKVSMYADEWRKVIDRMGRWVDMDNDYKTMDKDYMESIWWVFKQLWDKGLIYASYKSMHICPRCETTLSQFEVAEGYRTVKDLSVVAKFELKEIHKLGKVEVGNRKIYILSWTTTPWTLPGNLALAVGSDVEYAVVEEKNDYYILAKANLEKMMEGKEYKVVGEIKGSELVDMEYKPLFPYFDNEKLENRENAFKVYAADFVTIEDGTGVVHIAPAFGEDDMNLGKKENLPFVQHVAMDGRFIPEVKDFSGEEVKPKDDPMATDIKILKYLVEKDLLFKKEKYEHSYPYCWRCDSPLLNYATSSWFVKVTDIKDKALKTAKNINWMPDHIKEGRFGQWLEGARDWSISRQRFWGSVMPIWVCDKCEEQQVFGAISELEEASGAKVDDLHKHFVDKISFKCDKCDGEMKRIPDVLDCWFESGSMPYAQMHYPFENKEKFEKNFPAKFIAEGVDQTRAWFYYMHILANAIKGEEAFQNVIVNGIVLAEDGKKMSKRLSNYPDPMEVMDKYGADAMRYYLCSSQVMKADNFNFSERDLSDQTRFINILMNVLTFYETFVGELKIEDLKKDELTNVLDIWINSKLEEFKSSVTKRLDKYDLNSVREIPKFIDELSTWYIRRSRDRFKGEDEEDKMKALKVLRRILFHLARIMAPFIPYLAEHIYKELDGRLDSVHLEEWPEVEEKLIDKKVLDDMDITRKVVELGLAKRAEVKIKVRQPLQKATVFNTKVSQEYIELICEELNVKEVNFGKDKTGEVKVELDIKMSAELEEEGLLRELVRTINQMRKKAKLTINDRIIVGYSFESEVLTRVFDKFGDELKKGVLAEKLEEKKEFKEKVKVNEIEVGLEIKKV